MTIRDWHEAPWDAAGGRPIEGMKKLNAFYSLPYWEDLLINHLLDPMDVFKNVAVGIWQHINGDMDSVKAYKDLEELGVKNTCWIQDEQEIPDALWILTKEEEEFVKKTIGAIRTPNGTMHSLKSAFTSDDKELTGSKFHDWHKMLQVFDYFIM
ncbi:hypothetical protein L7F22_001261 [Adiantum nelumboides]|nr:hypothetical protein [Adiantum nelumboides]